jgi:hypothetical protein
MTKRPGAHHAKGAGPHGTGSRAVRRRRGAAEAHARVCRPLGTRLHHVRPPKPAVAMVAVVAAVFVRRTNVAHPVCVSARSSLAARDILVSGVWPAGLFRWF